MTLFRKFCSQKSIAFFSQARSTLLVREGCYNDSFRKSALHAKVQLNFVKRTLFTGNKIDSFTDNENVTEGTEELKNLSIKEIDDKFDFDAIPDNRSNIERNVQWSRLETRVLDSLVEKHGKDWDIVSQHMFDKTPEECKAQYEEVKNKSDGKKPLTGLPEFTESEIDQINDLIQKYGRNWRKIAKNLDFYGITAFAIVSFVKRNPDRFPSLYKGPISMKRYKGSAWTDDELKSLNELIIKYGRNYDAISEELPGRTPKAVERSISKHMLDLPALHSGKLADWFRSSTIWSESELRLLNELVETYGFNWEKISGYLPGRSPISCSAKFYGSWSTWNNKATALVPHKWPKEAIQFLDLLIEKYGKWQIIPILIPGITPANWFSPFCPQTKVWTINEKLILQYLVKTIGYNWEKISEYFPHRQRWSIIREVLGNIDDYESKYTNENDSISKLVMPKKRKRNSSHWTYEEVKKLYELKEKYSSNWYEISSNLPGRTPATCYLKDFVLLNACKEIDNKLSVLEICHLQELLRNHGTDWETIAKHNIKNKDINEIKNIVNENPKIFPPVLFGSQVRITSNWTEKEKELFKNLIATHGNNWKFIKNFFPKKTYKQIFDYYHINREKFPDEYSLNTNYWVFHRASWKKEENELLKELIQKHGSDFDYISKHFTDRTTSAIRAHVRNYPELFFSDSDQNHQIEEKYKKDQKGSNISWTTEDENKLLELVNSNPNDWDKIAAEFPSRSLNACKTKYRSLIKPEMTIPRFIDTYKTF